jgi:peptidoglycan/xylan/chitin deacetylase (PgdA/CDA1 family)
MCPEDLKLLVDMGHEVGSHGVSHTSLSTMPQPMVRELRISRSKIAEWTERKWKPLLIPIAGSAALSPYGFNKQDIVLD